MEEILKRRKSTHLSKELLINSDGLKNLYWLFVELRTETNWNWPKNIIGGDSIHTYEKIMWQKMASFFLQKSPISVFYQNAIRVAKLGKACLQAIAYFAVTDLFSRMDSVLKR